MPTYKSSIVSTAVDGDKTVFVWRLGQVRNVRSQWRRVSQPWFARRRDSGVVLACVGDPRPLRALFGSFGECVKSPGVRVGEKSFWQARFFPKVSPDSDDMQASVAASKRACLTVTGLHRPGLGVSVRHKHRLRAQGCYQLQVECCPPICKRGFISRRPHRDSGCFSLVIVSICVWGAAGC